MWFVYYAILNPPENMDSRKVTGLASSPRFSTVFIDPDIKVPAATPVPNILLCTMCRHRMQKKKRKRKRKKKNRTETFE
jgi:hypothetical protein